MQLLETAVRHIAETAKVPSFSTYEERLHPYIEQVFASLPGIQKIDVPGNNLIYRMQSPDSGYTIALTAHLDKINHYGRDFPAELPVKIKKIYMEGAMDDSAGLGIVLAMAEQILQLKSRPNLLFLFSEMEESKGLKEHPELLKNEGKGYTHGMGAMQISQTCLSNSLIPDEIITIDTTPLFKGRPGVALYSRHWKFTGLEPSPELLRRTGETEKRFMNIDSGILPRNNTNDFLHYGYEFNKPDKQERAVVSVALEPAIYPYHQKGERVFIQDIERVLNILEAYLEQSV